MIISYLVVELFSKIRFRAVVVALFYNQPKPLAESTSFILGVAANNIVSTASGGNKDPANAIEHCIRRPEIW